MRNNLKNILLWATFVSSTLFVIGSIFFPKEVEQSNALLVLSGACPIIALIALVLIVKGSDPDYFDELYHECYYQDVPSGYRWIAMDENGSVFCYSKRPVLNKFSCDEWLTNGSCGGYLACKYLGGSKTVPHLWKKSLRRIPKSFTNKHTAK